MSPNLSEERARALAKRVGEIGRSRRTRKIAIIILAVVAVLGIALFIAVPMVLRSILGKQVATALHRPVTVGHISFNPYTLRLRLQNLHVGEPSGSGTFVDLGGFDIKVSWTTLFHFAPVVSDVTVERPQIHVIRNADGTFNFSDLLIPSAAAPPPKPAPPSSPLKFAVSNIRLTDGDVKFDDQMLNQKHEIEKIEIGVPFVANFSSDIEVVVKPFLQMLVDGSPVRIVGETKPFGPSRDSVVDLRLHRLDLPRYAAYLPKNVPIKLNSGALSFDVLVHFVQTEPTPSIRANGAIALDQFDLRDAANAPVLGLDHFELRMRDVEPLARIAYIQAIIINGLKSNLVRNHDGTTNLSALTAPPAAPGAPPGSAATPLTMPTPAAIPSAAIAPPPVPIAPSIVTAAPAPSAVATAAPPNAQFDAAIDSLQMTDSTMNLTDLTGAKPALLELDGIHVTGTNLRTSGQAQGAYEVAANIKSGGAVDLKGTVNLPSSQATLNLTADKIDLAGLQDFAQSVFAGTINAGKVTTHANVQAFFAPGKLNVHAEPADLSLDELAITAPRSKEKAITWKHFGVTLGQFDLASKQATVKEVRSDGLHVSASRASNGSISLLSLMRKPAPPPRRRETRAERLERLREERMEREAARKARRMRIARAPKASPAPAEPGWKYEVESIVFEDTQARVLDRGSNRPVRIDLGPVSVHVKNVSSDFAKPFDLDVAGTLNRRGTFKVSGNAAIEPLKAEVKIATKRLQLRDAQAYVNTKLNAEITNATLTMDGSARVAKQGKDFHAGFLGNVTIGDMTAIDKLTGDDFLKWSALSFSRIDADIGSGPPKVSIRKVSLDDFYARIILSSSGKLNLNDIVAKPEAAPKSLTRAEGEPGAAPPQPSAAPTPAAPPPAAPAAAPTESQPIPAIVTVDQTTFNNGKVDYTDDFIKPNYSANLSDITGKVGTIGTRTTNPADVDVQGHVNGSAPIQITGAINPLAPMASLDIKAKADGIELMGLTPYSTKYTGYPIEKGTLTVDVHYMLNQGQLSADNHIFIDQLTFGDRVENSTAMNLPIRLAVSLLKNSKGEIDLNIPISGSLNDPKFSLGGVILHAVVNLIMKAVTSPFTLLASAIGGASGGHDLSYVAFKPGYSTLTPDAKTQLDTIAKALQERSGLKMSIAGRVDPNVDLEGLKHAKVDDAIEAQKIYYLGSDAKDKQVTTEEYDKFVKRAYSKADFKKPRNAIGLAKSLPTDEMKKLMVENTQVNNDDLKKLADARADAVRSYMGTKVDAARLFLTPPKLNANGITDAPTSRADLSLQ